MKYMGLTLWDHREASCHVLPAVADVVKRTRGIDVEVIRVACTMVERVMVSPSHLRDAEQVRTLVDALLECVCSRPSVMTSELVIQLLLKKTDTKPLEDFVGDFWTPRVFKGLQAIIDDDESTMSLVRHAISMVGYGLEKHKEMEPFVKKMFLDEVTALGRRNGDHMGLQGEILRLFFKLHVAAPDTTPITEAVMQHALALMRKASTQAGPACYLAATAARLLQHGGADHLPRQESCELALLALKVACCPSDSAFEFGRSTAVEAVELVHRSATHSEAKAAIAALQAAAAVFPFDHKWHVKVQAVVDKLKPALDTSAEGASEGQGGVEEEGGSNKRARVV